MKLFKISTIALAMGLTGWVACGDSGNNKPDAPPLVIPGTGGSISPDTASGSGGTGGTGGATGTLDSGVPYDTGRDVPIVTDASDASIVEAGPIDGGVTPPPLDGGPPPDKCAGLTPAQCHDAIINAATDPSVSALDPGANPTVPYPNCSAL